MTRIAENQLVGIAVLGVQNNRSRIAKYSEEVTSGLKVTNPGDSDLSGTISQFKQSLSKIDDYKKRATTVGSMLSFQEETFSQAEDLIIRVKEIAAQAANETNGVEVRQHMAREVWQYRDQLVSLANSTYEGRYIFGGTADNDPPFDLATAATAPNIPYTSPTTGEAHDRYYHDGIAGRSDNKTVNITDDLTIQINTNGGSIFSNAINAIERLGRALDGYKTTPAAGTPDGGGAAYTFPSEFSQQTNDIKNAMDLMETARTDDILEERIAIGGKQKRLEIANSLLDLTKVNTEDLLDKLQNADTVESASNLAQAQNALEASFAVTSKLLNLSILDYI